MPWFQFACSVSSASVTISTIPRSTMDGDFHTTDADLSDVQRELDQTQVTTLHLKDMDTTRMGSSYYWKLLCDALSHVADIENLYCHASVKVGADDLDCLFRKINLGGVKRLYFHYNIDNFPYAALHWIQHAAQLECLAMLPYEFVDHPVESTSALVNTTHAIAQRPSSALEFVCLPDAVSDLWNDLDWGPNLVPQVHFQSLPVLEHHGSQIIQQFYLPHRRGTFFREPTSMQNSSNVRSQATEEAVSTPAETEERTNNTRRSYTLAYLVIDEGLPDVAKNTSRHGRQVGAPHQPWRFGDGTCVVCLDSMVGSRQPLVTLFCGHGFHYNCFNQYHGYSGDMSCPTCRS